MINRNDVYLADRRRTVSKKETALLLENYLSFTAPFTTSLQCSWTDTMLPPIIENLPAFSLFASVYFFATPALNLRYQEFCKVRNMDKRQHRP
jgi:hypothetical protein